MNVGWRRLPPRQDRTGLKCTTCTACTKVQFIQCNKLHIITPRKLHSLNSPPLKSSALHNVRIQCCQLYSLPLEIHWVHCKRNIRAMCCCIQSRAIYIQYTLRALLWMHVRAQFSDRIMRQRKKWASADLAMSLPTWSSTKVGKEFFQQKTHKNHAATAQFRMISLVFTWTFTFSSSTKHSCKHNLFSDFSSSNV